MDEQKTIEEEEPKPGVRYLYDSNGKLIGELSQEDYERGHKNFDEEFMCDKLAASFLRKWREQHQKKSNA